MLFNSIDFAIFLPLVFIVYWFITQKSLKLQNAFIVVASYIFYGWWDWRFLSLIIVSTLADFIIGLFLSKEQNNSKRKFLLVLSICINLGLLGFFKYFNFFAESFSDAFTLLGYNIKPTSLNIILPVGISFYTFQTLSYTIDLYKRKIEHTRDIIAFAAFVSFFPQLVAGPIERAANLLPQFKTKRTFNYSEAIDGLRQILWGLFKKIVIADSCAEYANLIFNNYGDYSGSTLLLGAFFFAVQIYGDFSGYSDIAIGTSRLFGFNLMQNFAFPYFSRDIAEFWRRWHISLSTWFRDYVYIPLGGSRVSKFKQIRNTIIVFVVSGFWHGANWTFIAWGFLNALYFLPLLLTKKNRTHLNIIAEDKLFPSFKNTIQILFTFFLTLIAWVFFRSENIISAFGYLSEMFSFSFFTIPQVRPYGILILVFVFFAIEWIGRRQKFAIATLFSTKKAYLRWIFYYLLLLFILYFALNQPEQQFIYFQF
jgi:D-alanyl-lipoteichoic acid acyltransferase DltB (MBOAT superfamily)